MDELLVCHLGLVPYGDALELQERLREARIGGGVGDVLLLLEHTPVVTRGRRSEPSELGLGEDFLRGQGVEVVTTQRGGFATYHGPGMLVGYPIVAVEDVRGYLRTLEGALIGALADEGVQAYRRESTPAENLTGVWVGGPDELRGDGPPHHSDGHTVPHPGKHRKIASLGVHVSRGIAMHGFALGVDNDLTPWDWFTPCRLPTAHMTSVAAETGRHGRLDAVRREVACRVAAALGYEPRTISRAKLEAMLPAAATSG